MYYHAYVLCAQYFCNALYKVYFYSNLTWTALGIYYVRWCATKDSHCLKDIK